MDTSRLIIVSNRLPVAACVTGGGVRVTPANGGLATGVGPWHEQSNGIWVGWPGDVSTCTSEQRRELDQRLRAQRIAPVHLSPEQLDLFYHGFSNRVLWPLFHYLIDRVPVDAGGWDMYREANAAFADAVVSEYRPGDLIWVHDYQLMLVPAMLRERLPDARIGFFLHIPFPSSEVFRILPWRRDILAGLLGADLLGFHTFSYMRHFVASLLHVDGVEVDIDRVVVGQRDVRLGVFPMGVDASRFAQLSSDAVVLAEADALRREVGARRLILGVDRLDYTKGIPRRLQAIERVLSREPALAERIRYVQVAVPSRGEVDSYQRFRRQVEELVGHINGTYGTVGSTPVHYMHRPVSIEQLVALYRAADVMLVTPLRDGMNLVAKEFIASRIDEDGVLILSEFTGAAAELDGAMVVNPYDVDAVADSLQRAMSMSEPERRARMSGLRRRVIAHDVRAWARTFIEGLEATRPAMSRPAAGAPDPGLFAVLTEARRRGTLRLLLDYDGTLVPLARAPELAAPDDELLALLGLLATSPGIVIDIVSGRPRETLQRWFGALPVSLWAEHGFWHCSPAGTAWDRAAHISRDWIDRLRPILEQFTASTPGSLIEEKTASIAWHYRDVHREFGARQAHELRMLLGDALSNQPFEVLEGKKVIEVRLRGVSKGLVARRVVDETGPGVEIVAIGDDRTDEDLFRALPAAAVTVAVGQRPTRAAHHLADYRAVRRVLGWLLDSADAAGGGNSLTSSVHTSISL